MTQSPSERVVDAFRRRFGVPPSVVASAPGRVNIVGEHVDYAGGVVLPMPIAERTAVAMSGIRDGQAAASERARSIAGTHGCEVESLDLEAFESAPAPARFEALPSDSPCAWLNAAIGPLRQLVEAGIAVPAVRAVIASDVPIGAGLSSSAALATALAAAALRLAGRELPAARLAALLQSAERRFVGTPCGIMDMMTAIVGRPSCALRLDCRSLRFEAIPLPASITMLLVDTGVRHALGSSDYGRRRAEVEQASAALGVSSLRDADLELVERAALPDALRRRARHVVREIARVDRAVAALRSDDAAELGRIVSASHASLRDDFDVSVPEVDRVVELALRADPGVLGARMVGGGFGGAVLVVASSSRVDHVERSLRELGLAAPPHSIRRVRPGAGYTASVVEELPS